MGPTPISLKLLAAALILLSSAAGVAVPLVLRRRSEGSAAAVAKAFAAGVVLATGFVHVLPDAMGAMGDVVELPVPGFVVMAAAMGTLAVDSAGTWFYERRRMENWEDSRQIVAAQILELGVVSHSLIIGLSLGVSQKSSTITPLVAALFFHQFFEGFALGGCISQAGFHNLKTMLMAFFFAITTPGGIALGITTASFYDPESETATIVQGILDSISAGILIYMAMVDLIAMEFIGLLKSSSVSLRVILCFALFLGAASMSMLAIWA